MKSSTLVLAGAGKMGGAMLQGWLALGPVSYTHLDVYKRQNQPRGRLFDDVSRLVSDAAGMASSVRREVETIVKTQMERLLSSMDVVQREEFEAVKEMAALAREENDKLEARIKGLEAKLGTGENPQV